MSTSKKDFDAAVRLIKDTFTEKDERQAPAMLFAHFFAESSVRFDRARFLAAALEDE